MTRWRIVCLTAVLAIVTAVPAAAQPAAAEIVARSVQAHGGDALSSWQTLTITGTVLMQDGIAYNGAYTLYAKAPDRLRVEHDATADRGRAFYEYFLNGGVAWSRRNLVPGALEVDRIRRWLDQCYGIAFYARPAVALELKPDADLLAWPPDAAATTPATSPTPPRRVWVIAATVGTESRELFIDQETYRFLKEATPQGTRVYSEFKSFDGTIMPTRILEITRTRQGESRTPITWTSVTRNAPIEDRRFTEDKPAVVR
jgi:hypothetical protein